MKQYLSKPITREISRMRYTIKEGEVSRACVEEKWLPERADGVYSRRRERKR